MRCSSCGSDNSPGDRYCSTCGESLVAATATDHAPQRYLPQPPSWAPNRDFGGYGFFSRMFGGISWLLVSLGTLLVAFGYLGVVNSAYSYSGSPQTSFDMAGYGMIIYGIAAIFVALNRFARDR